MSLREKIRDWLLGDELRDLEWAKENLEDASNELIKSKAAMQLAENNYMLARYQEQESKRLVNQLMDVGVNTEFHSDDHSWAVVCLRGKPEYVKFIPLKQKDARDIIEFLKHFEYSNISVDSPFYYRNIINDHVLENPFLK